MNRVSSYNVFDLGRCNLSEKETSLLSIPKLQRGQVWKPRQVELLWDSLLRNFPIGTLIVLSEDSSKEQPKGELIDGQQRVSAIISGFQPISPKSDCIVWVDVNASELKDRKYAIRVTNRAHPWGYALDGSVYEARRRKTAIIHAEEIPGTSKLEWNILNFGPEGDGVLPIPLLFFLNANSDNKCKDVISQCEGLAEMAPVWGKKYLAKVKELNESCFEMYFSAIQGLRDNDYSIPSIIIDTQDDLDLLFSRIGVQGTAITNKELAYALMKSYWDSESFGPINKSVSEGLVSEEDFAQLVFRLFSSRTSLRGDITPEYVRSLQQNLDKDPEKELVRKDVLSAYDNNGDLLRTITNLVKDWLLNCPEGGTHYHPIIATEIATKKPSLYVLLLKIALLETQGKSELSPAFIQALAFYMYTCLYNDKAINWIYSCISYLQEPVKEEFVSGLLRDCISFSCEWALPIKDSFADYPALNDDAFDKDWTYERYSREFGSFLFERLFRYGSIESAFILKLAEHNYFNQQYSDYNPSRKDLWADLNRPWDHDHIIPQNWIGENTEWSQFCSLWINSIGNIADIPFELNRQKQDDADWSYYCEHADDLLFEPTQEILSLNEKLSDPGYDVQRKVFFNFVWKRFLAIAEPFLRVLGNLHLSDGLSENQLLRKRIIMSAWKQHPDCKLYYLHNGIEYEFKENEIFGWQQAWVSLSKDIGHPERVVSLTLAIDDDNKFEAECGLRKRPELYVEQMNNHRWWESFARGKVSAEEVNGEWRAYSYHGWDLLKEFNSLMEKYNN